MNVWAEANMSQPQDIYVALLPKKQLPKSPESGASSRPWRAERAHDDRAKRLGFRHACKWDWKGLSRNG